MAASVQTRYYHGSSPGVASSDVTGATVRHKLADNDIQDSNNPIPLPAAGMNLGWRKSSKVNFTTTPAGSITNLRWFISGGPPAGIRFFARVQIAGQYIFATSNDQNGITNFTDTVGNQNANDVALVPYNSSTPLTVQAGTVLSNPSIGEGGINQVFVETQLGVQSTYAGGPGPITPFQATYRYSET
jgi:hypothetical protein